MELCNNNTCGSIINGHRRPWVTRMALSTDTSSVGRPHILHSRTSTGVDRIDLKVQFSEHGTPDSYITKPTIQSKTEILIHNENIFQPSFNILKVVFSLIIEHLTFTPTT
jgi:hypothetical protein